MLVEDNGPIHTSRPSRAALAACAHWLRVECLPKYAPSFNFIETVWRDLKPHHPTHMTFEGVNREINAAVQALDAQRVRMRVRLAKSRISV